MRDQVLRFIRLPCVQVPFLPQQPQGTGRRYLLLPSSPDTGRVIGAAYHAPSCGSVRSGHFAGHGLYLAEQARRIDLLEQEAMRAGLQGRLAFVVVSIRG